MEIKDFKKLIGSLSVHANEISWSLYYFRYSSEKFHLYKMHFKDANALTNHVKNKLDFLLNVQLNDINSIDHYNGFNSQKTVDSMSIDNELIKSGYQDFIRDFAEAKDKVDENSLNGHVIIGEKAYNSDFNLSNIYLFSFASPIVNFKKKKTEFYNIDNSEMSAFSEKLYTLCINTDSIIYDSNIYNFNHKFERFFKISKTIQNIKKECLKKIEKLRLIDNQEEYNKYMQTFKWPSILVTYDENKAAKLKSEDEYRKKVSLDHKFKLDEKEQSFILPKDEDKLHFTQFLCNKRIVEKDTNKIFESNSMEQAKK